MTLDPVTLIVPFYRNVAMLRRQVQEWELYPEGVQIVVVDDGSPERAKPIIEAAASVELRERIALYRILVDIPWNREEARNLGARESATEWIVQVDIDHVLPCEAAKALVTFRPDGRRWYRFPRWRKGRADETRRKDRIPDACEFGRIHEHVDSYLIRRSMYMDVGGYDLRFSGCLGGGSDFLKRLAAHADEPLLLPLPMCLHVYTRTEILDASDWSLSRDTAEGKRRTRARRAQKVERCAVRSAWEREL